MTTAENIAKEIPSDMRTKILLEWIPQALPSMANNQMKLLFEAWFLYVDINGIKKPDCQLCVNNIFEGWKSMAPYLAKEQKQYNLLEQL